MGVQTILHKDFKYRSDKALEGMGKGANDFMLFKKAGLGKKRDVFDYMLDYIFHEIECFGDLEIKERFNKSLHDGPQTYTG